MRDLLRLWLMGVVLTGCGGQWREVPCAGDIMVTCEAPCVVACWASPLPPPPGEVRRVDVSRSSPECVPLCFDNRFPRDGGR